MEQHGRKVEESLIWVGDKELSPYPFDRFDLTNEQADRIVHDLVDRQKADGIIAVTDEWAAQIIRAIKRRKLRVPEDVRVFGYGNYRISTLLDPEITTLDPQNKVFAKAAIEMLTEMIENPSAHRRSQIANVKPKLIVRQST